MHISALNYTLFTCMKVVSVMVHDNDGILNKFFYAWTIDLKSLFSCGSMFLILVFNLSVYYTALCWPNIHEFSEFQEWAFFHCLCYH